MRTVPHGFEFLEDCLTCKWRSDKSFCNFDPTTLKAFDDLTFTNVYPAGSVLYAEAQPTRGIFLLCRGSAKLSISAADGKTLITRVAQQGEVLGISSAYTGNPYKSTAETLEPAQVNFVRREDFLRFVQQYQDSCVNAARQLALDCETDADQIRVLGLSHSAAEKLAHLLLLWCGERGKETETGPVQLLMTHEDIAQMIGSARETVTRTLKEFRDKRIIALRGSSLTVLNKAALEAFVLQ